MQKKILVIDDSALMRRVLSDIINSDHRFQVTKLANNGLEALEILKSELFDAVILDINMPVMNGLELLQQLEHHNIKVKVIMVSTVAKKGARETIKALELGAFDFVTKPENFYEVKSEIFSKKLMEVLVVATMFEEETSLKIPQKTALNHVLPQSALSKPVIKDIHEKDMQVKDSMAKAFLSREMTTRHPLDSSSHSSKLVVIVSSTGGPKALQSVIPYLMKELTCSVVIVQHMPEGFTFSLAQRLNEMSLIDVKEAENGDILKNGVAYIAKGGSHLKFSKSEIRHMKLAISDDPPRGGLKPCADIMYESLVESDFDEIICVVLTGMGGDGTAGIRKLKEKKKIYVIAQDQGTSTVYGMPKVVAEAGLVDEVVPLERIAVAIQKNLGVR